ncbi:Inositolphosphorylceramide synthase subunit Kei1-domain-containing protein [Chaetomidium leptoderma]|uniref:Inositolphosphorylceramide synthase subunit Kei1-domain-containing protein n=1 Tax=Chaetomidium leptoderma TaxID=669021 RepID=A0AAN6VXA3_9PEZI|nr:Inositolphosphorylceramide synthase subunit Kei1-domain-containing protein [Chaetomidium leptoderma]
MQPTSRSSWLRLPRPKSFLGFMSLQTGTELISIALLFNKATGAYGMLTLFTGYSLSALQVTAYLGSIFVLVTLALCLAHIRKQSPLQNLALAWVYAIDTVVSAAYTAAFATTWYAAGMHDLKGPAGAEPDTGSPSNWEVQHDAGQEAQVKAGTGVHDISLSIVLIVAFTLIRFYFALVITACARMALLRFVDERMGESEDVSDISPDPFAVGAPLGEGWRGKFGRAMVSVGRGYWLGGKKEDEEWARAVHSKFRSTKD